MKKPVLKVLALAMVALLLLTGVAVHAAPMLGVSWRAAANATVPGVKILSVNPDSNAEELGLKVGDTVLAINDIVVKTGQQATAEVIKAKGKMTLLVQDASTRALVEIKADIDEPVAGLVAGPNVAGKYKNITRTRK